MQRQLFVTVFRSGYTDSLTVTTIMLMWAENEFDTRVLDG